MTIAKIEFRRHNNEVERFIKIGSRTLGEKVISSRPDLPKERDFYISYLDGDLYRIGSEKLSTLNYIDLFSGGGGLSLGIKNSARFLGMDARMAVSVDNDPIVTKLVEQHFSPIVSRTKSIEELIRYEVDLSGNLKDFITPPVILDAQIEQFRGKIDLLVGGPPCQGHSNLNNQTRHFDPRNLLYLVMPAFAIALNVPNLIVENVQNIGRSKENVVKISKNILETNGYNVQEDLLNACDFGVAQSRKRHFLVASNRNIPELKSIAQKFKATTVSFNDVCDGLPKLENPYILEDVTNLSQENLDRINYLHDKGEYDLPNERRPDCHKIEHSYPAVYGRIKGDQPVQTVTTGFSSPGRGRYIHPTERRMLNIREAGRVQAFPDSYWTPAIDLNFKRANFTKIIGDAVPSLLAYPLMATLFGDLNNLTESVTK